MAKRQTSRKNSTTRASGGRASRASVAAAQKRIEQYEHSNKTRLNNPPVGLVTPETEPAKAEARQYAYDPHLDPQLVWAGKAEHTSFEVPTVSLHVHERIDARTIIEAVRARTQHEPQPSQPSLFEQPKQNLPLRDAIDFYKHPHGWSNRLIAGDSLLVMNSLLEKEGMGGQVQMIYIDPPYGVEYKSNFQPFVNKRDVKDRKDEDLTQEPEMIRAFRDTWELGIHSYLTYLRDRLVLARDLLAESGSIFVQISDENVHHVRELLDELFGSKNFVALIPFAKTAGAGAKVIGSEFDYLVWFAKDVHKVKARQLYLPKAPNAFKSYRYAFSAETGDYRYATTEERADPSKLPKGWKLAQLSFAVSQDPGKPEERIYEFNGVKYDCGENRHWKTKNPEGLDKLANARRLIGLASQLNYVRYYDDFPATPVTNNWSDTGSAGFSSSDPKIYVVQTDTVVVQRCVLMTSDPGDLVFDPTCGSGTTAYVAEQWGRRWITCDTSRVAIALTKQRLIGAVFDYYQLAHAAEGVGSGFRYKTIPHVTLKSIANNPEIGPGMSQEKIEAVVAKYAEQEVLYDQPHTDTGRARVSGPFTVEAVPAPTVRSLDDMEVDRPEETASADASVARFGSTLRHSEWRAELLKTGLRGKGGQKIDFSRVEPLGGTRWLHADAETKGVKPERVVVSFGPEHAPLEQRQVELAWEEARTLNPKPSIIVFAAFEFDPEAAKDIDELTPEKTKMTFLTAKMNGDLLTEDLKKKRSSNESFWLMGRPDVDVRAIKSGQHKGMWQVEVLGFDYFNTRTGRIESGDTSKIAVWLLDTDYDGRSLYHRQVFFPMAGENDGWARLAKNLKAEIDQKLIEKYRGTVSLPFESGTNRRVAVKVVDDRGIESLKIVDLR